MIRILYESVDDLIKEHEIKKLNNIQKTPIGFSEKEQKWYG